MRYRLRTLSIALAIGPPALAVAWWLRERLGEFALVFVAFFLLGILAYAVLVAAARLVDSARWR